MEFPPGNAPLTTVQLLVFLQVFLEVEGFPTGGLRAGEGFLVHVLVLLVVLPGGKKPIPAPGDPTQAPQDSQVLLTFRYWRLEKILPQPSKSHRRISRFAAFLKRKTQEKILFRKEEEGWKSFGMWNPAPSLLTHLPFSPPAKSFKTKQKKPFQGFLLPILLFLGASLAPSLLFLRYLILLGPI